MTLCAVRNPGTESTDKTLDSTPRFMYSVIVIKITVTQGYE